MVGVERGGKVGVGRRVGRKEAHGLMGFREWAGEG